MPRAPKGPRLYFRKARRDAAGRVTRDGSWVIRDGDHEESTGASQADLGSAENALALYIARKHDPRGASDSGERNPAVADVLALYLTDQIGTNAALSEVRYKEAKARIRRLGDFFEGRTVASLEPRDFRLYARDRGRAARRELEDLRAALNYAFAEHVLSRPVPVVMPDKYQSRQRWLTRSEAARLIWTAWRLRQTYPAADGSQQPTSRAIGKHVARFILVALYTGSRAGVICGAAVGPTIGRGFIDLDTGQFHRKPIGEVETKKRAPTIILPPALLGHIRRWNEACKRKRGRPLRSVVEWNGAPVGRINKAFRAVREAAGFGEDVVPHTLRHTTVSWGLQNGGDRFDLGRYVGMSQDTLDRTYGHHDMKTASRVAAAISGRTVRAAK